MKTKYKYVNVNLKQLTKSAFPLASKIKSSRTTTSSQSIVVTVGYLNMLDKNMFFSFILNSTSPRYSTCNQQPSCTL